MPQICPRYPLYILMISQDIANISPIFAQDIPQISPRSDFIFVTGTKGGTRAENSVMWRHFFLYKTDVKKSPQIYLRYPLSCFLDIPNISQDIHQVSPEMFPKYPQIYPPHNQNLITSQWPPMMTSHWRHFLSILACEKTKRSARSAWEIYCWPSVVFSSHVGGHLVPLKLQR